MQDFYLWGIILIIGLIAYIFVRTTLSYDKTAKYEDSTTEFKKTIYYKNSLKNSKNESETSETDKDKL
jgi:hypothetical protein